MYRALYERVSEAVCKIIVEIEGDVVSEGSGFAFTSDGEVVTAAHVVSGRTPIRAEDIHDPAARIHVAFPGREVVLMHPVAWGPTIVVPQFKEPIVIDLAILHPPSSLALRRWLPVVLTPPSLGSELFMAGYPDDLRLPFEIQRRLHTNVTGAPEFLRAMQRGYITDMTGPLIKRAVVGNCRRIIAASDAVEIRTDVFYLDNAMHNGASGGPIFDAAGNALGIVTERAMTSASQKDAPGLAVPSGATVGISLHAIDALREFVRAQRRKGMQEADYST